MRNVEKGKNVCVCVLPLLALLLAIITINNIMKRLTGHDDDNMNVKYPIFFFYLSFICHDDVYYMIWYVFVSIDQFFNPIDSIDLSIDRLIGIFIKKGTHNILDKIEAIIIIKWWSCHTHTDTAVKIVVKKNKTQL